MSCGGIDQLHLALTFLSTPTLCHPVNVATNGTPVAATVAVRGPASPDQGAKVKFAEDRRANATTTVIGLMTGCWLA